jgi:hypothetical protein
MGYREKMERRLADMYSKAERVILKQIMMLEALPNSEDKVKRLQRVSELQKQTQAELARLNKDSQKWTKEAVSGAYNGGVKEARTEIKKQTGKPLTGFKGFHVEAIAAMENQAYTRIASVMTTAGLRTADVYNEARLRVNLFDAMAGKESVTKLNRRLLDDMEARGITGFVDKAGREWNLARYAEMLGRTTVNNAYREAKINELLVRGYDLVIISSHGTECEKCKPWEREVLSISGESKKYRSLAEAREQGLFHPNCVLGGTIVSGPRIAAHYSRWYEGKLISIKASSGDELSCTPNHPILTPKGWIAVGNLNKGDKIVQYVGDQRSIESCGCVDPDNVQVPSRIEDIVSTLFESGKVTTVSVPVAAEDFHGDGFNSKVDIVRTDRFLINNLVPSLQKLIGQEFLVNAFDSCFGFDALCASDQLFLGVLHTSDCIMRRARLFESLFGRQSRHAALRAFAPCWGWHDSSFYPTLLNAGGRNADSLRHLLLCLSSFVSAANIVKVYGDFIFSGFSDDNRAKVRESDSVLFTQHLNTSFADAETDSDLLDRLSGKIKVLDVVDRNISDFAGHVYNLQTEQGWFIANNIITHNCEHALSGWRDIDEELAAIDESKLVDISSLMEDDSTEGLSSGEGDTDGISTISNKEPFDIRDSKAVESAFKKFVDEIADSPIEKAVVISPDGYKYDVDGVSGRVGVHLVGEDSLKGAKVIHNHPGADADSFSKDDFGSFFEYSYNTLEVAYNGKRHRMEWVGERLTKEEARKIYNEGLNSIRLIAKEHNTQIEDEQYNIMRYLRENLKGLRFYEL